MDLTNPLEIQLKLMTTAYFYGDFSTIYPFTNHNSMIYNAVIAGDVNALSKFASKNDIEIDELSDESIEKYNQFHHQLTSNYKSQLEKNPLPLPAPYLEELADRAIELGNYSTAHSALQAINSLDKKVNEFIVKGVELLQSKEVKGSEVSSDESGSDSLDERIRQVAFQFYQAIRIKEPLGHQFQYLGPNLYLENSEALRKYMKYVELNLIKELLEFGIQYLADDRAIAERIIKNLPSSKIKRLFLKHFAEFFSLGSENYQAFVRRYQEAVKLLKNAKEDREFLTIQKVLLGRGTGDNQYYQFLRELAVEHPISTLLVTIELTSDGTPYIAPIILKSGISLMEFLELDK